MTEQTGKIAKNKGFIHKIAVLGKDYYSIAEIDNLFIFAGADPKWWKVPTDAERISSQRVQQVYGWVEGLSVYAPEQADKILAGVAQQITENERIPLADKAFLERSFSTPYIQSSKLVDTSSDVIIIPGDAERLLEYIINGLPRAMFPLKHRREGLPHLEFDNEYDVQSLLHALLGPWIKDIRAEEYTPSYAGSSTRIDFLLPKYNIVCEVKFIRSKHHGTKIGNELILDVAHYKTHPSCKQLWIVIYDPNNCIPNPGGLISDLEKQADFKVRIFHLGMR